MRRKRMNVIRIKNEINRILYHSDAEAFPDKQLLTITVDSKKAHHFNFLKGFTKWGAVGTWKEFPDEHNTVIEIEYRENARESNGKRLKALLNLFNMQVVNEKLLYMRTTPVEVSSL
jgi:hypothetical protein